MMSLVDLNVKFAGLDMPVPVGVSAQAPFNLPAYKPDRLAETYEKHVKAGAGFIYTGYAVDEEEHPENKLPTGRFLREETVGFGISGMYCTADTARVIVRLNTLKEVIRILKKKVDVPIISSIMPISGEPKPWADLAEKVQSFGADAVELDISCPLTGGETVALDAFTKRYLPVFGAYITPSC
ncbi:MAG: hypothetical protein ACE5PO_04655, partial [Candidatus Bathyarchaeia archaeon]